MVANQVLIKHGKNWGLDEELILSLTNKALRLRKLDGVEVSLVFVGRKKAKELNMRYRNKDYIPQVLGFPLSREKDADGITRLGDIVICSQKVKYEATFRHKSVEEILKEWLLHGVDNLLIQ